MNFTTESEYCCRPAAVAFYEQDRIATSLVCQQLEIKIPMQGDFVFEDTRQSTFIIIDILYSTRYKFWSTKTLRKSL
jgi:hypothetical protein